MCTGPMRRRSPPFSGADRLPTQSPPFPAGEWRWMRCFDESPSGDGESKKMRFHQQTPSASPSAATTPEMARLHKQRIIIANIKPQIDCGRYSVKCVAGDTVTVTADIFRDGHDLL